MIKLKNIRITKAIGLILLFIILFTLYAVNKCSSAQETDMIPSGTKKPKHIILLGASVGKAWDISELPKRINNYNYAFETVTVYSFDKSKELLEILNRSQNKPEAIIIKECAAYFPGNFEEYKNLIIECVNLCRKNNVVPILATVVPVLKSFPLRSLLINLREKKIRFPFHAFDGIITFNDWIRSYANKEGIVVLDLEEALRISCSDRHLNAKFAKKDGLHLNERGYKELDKIVIPTLNKIEWIKQ